MRPCHTKYAQPNTEVSNRTNAHQAIGSHYPSTTRGTFSSSHPASPPRELARSLTSCQVSRLRQLMCSVKPPPVLLIGQLLSSHSHLPYPALPTSAAQARKPGARSLHISPECLDL